MMRQGLLQGGPVVSSIFAICIVAVMMALAFPAATAAAEGPRVTTSDDRALAQQLVSGTIGSYSSYTRMQFTDGVSDDFPTDKYAFVNRVERSYYKARPIQLDYFISVVNRTGDKLSVSFSWEKKAMVRATGLQQKLKGQCIFVYDNQDGKWQLYDIKGQSPF